jgi:hypothetical protein
MHGEIKFLRKHESERDSRPADITRDGLSSPNNPAEKPETTAYFCGAILD